MSRAIENPIDTQAIPYNLELALVAEYKFRCPGNKLYPNEPDMRRFKALNMTPVRFTQEIADIANWAMWTISAGFYRLADDAKKILGNPTSFIAVKPWTEVGDCGSAAYYYLRWNQGFTQLEEMIETDFQDRVRVDTGTIVLWWDNYEGAGWSHRKILEWHTDMMAEAIVKYSGKDVSTVMTAARNIMNFALNSPSYIAFGTKDGSIDMTPRISQ